MAFLNALSDKHVPIFADEGSLVEGITKVLSKFIGNREFCLKTLKLISNVALPEGSKKLSFQLHINSIKF